MFLQILLSVLCIQFAVASNATTNADNSAADFDDFIPYLAPSVNDEIGWRLFQQFTSAKGHKNVIISPISLKLVLALLYEGSGGLTEREFQNILHFPADKEVLRKKFAALLDALVEKRQSYIINIGTQLFLDNHLTPLRTYQSKAYEFYHAEIARTNFSSPHNASSEINTWVEFLTNGRIKTLVTPDDVENAVLLVANSIYFKGMWLHPFRKNETFSGGFHVSKNEVASVPYMQQVNKFFHTDSDTLGAQILRLPYKGRKFGIYFILPHNKDGLSYLIDHLDLTELTLSLTFLVEKPVRVIMPKFRFDFQAKYSNILREFGFDTLFRGIASFPGIVRDQEAQLIVTDILQKSGIDVNEEGSIIYTATQVQIGNKFGGETVHTFNMSHPFLFFIEEQTTKNILFIGKYENPMDFQTEPTPSRFGAIGGNKNKVPLAESSQPATPGLYNPTAVPASPDSQFDIELLKHAYGTSKNVLLSPSSIKVSLAMLGEAAVGRTAEEIYDVLGIPAQQRSQVLSNLVSELSKSQPRSLLEFQNALFVSNTKKIKAQYQATVETYFRALVKQINYNEKVRAASEINGFVKNATKGFIPTIISPEEIDYNTEIILTNVLYFKADWLKTFDNKLTKAGYFHSPRSTVTVQFMHIIDTFYYAETPNAHIIKLDYAGELRAMLLVVPKPRDGLLTALKDLEVQGFKKLLAILNQTEVELILPKFQIDYNQNLIAILQKMGIKQVFDSNSNLSNLIEGTTPSNVGSFIHKTKVEVTEEGTEASAVSLVSVIPLMGSSSPKVRVDHPFAFFIYNTQTSNILFEGILNEPEQFDPAASTANPYATYSQTLQNKARNPTHIQQIPEQRPFYQNNRY